MMTTRIDFYKLLAVSLLLCVAVANGEAFYPGEKTTAAADLNSDLFGQNQKDIAVQFEYDRRTAVIGAFHSTYLIVSNNGTVAASEQLQVDFSASEYMQVSWSCRKITGQGECPVAGGTSQTFNQTLNLDAGDIYVYRINFNPTASESGPAEAFAVISDTDGTDAFPGNNADLMQHKPVTDTVLFKSGIDDMTYCREC